MLNKNCEINDFIDFLFFGHDIESNFDINDRIPAYKNKYTRILTSKLNDGDEYYYFEVFVKIYNNFIKTIEDNEDIHEYLNQNKLLLIKNILNFNNFKRLVFNNRISISFVELNIEDDEIWNSIKDKIMDKLDNFKKLIFNDSKSNFRILTLEVSLVESEDINYPDLQNYNLNIISEYLNLIKNDFSLLDNNKSELIKTFTGEMKYFLSTNRIVNGLYSDYFEMLNLKSIFNKYNLEKLYMELMSYVSNENIDSFIMLQYKLFEFIYNNYNEYEINDGVVNCKYIYLFISLDIFLYNKTRFIGDINDIKKVFYIYNFLIIKLQDIFDTISQDQINKRTFVFMYKNQLHRSRNKIKERMEKICLD